MGRPSSDEVAVFVFGSGRRDGIKNTGFRTTERIVREFAPDKVILFGSQASGHAREDSDVDLLVILPFQGSSFRKSLDILNHLDPHFPIDLIARRPEETTQRYAQGDPLIREALDKGKILYERRH